MPQARYHSTYLARALRADGFLARGFGDLADRQAAVADAAKLRVDPALLEEIRRQNEGLAPSPGRDENVRALGVPGTVVVATGQQVGLFLGPLYTIHKAASAVAAARLLASETGARVVPLFWLQTEDHDFPEIAGSITPRQSGEALRLVLPTPPGEERVSLAHRILPAEITALALELEQELAGLPHGEEVGALVRAWYRPGIPVGRAFAGVLSALFAADGLVLYDPRQTVGMRLAAPVLKAAVGRAAELDALLGARGRALREAGFGEQVPLRAGTSLVFFHPAGPLGPRQRLQLRQGGLGIPGGPTLAQGELEARIDAEPLCVSTSALLRPLVQDTLLPTAAYVGGPAEVDYFTQLSPLYPAFGLRPPLVVPRARFTLVPARLRRVLDELGLEARDLDRPEDELTAQLARGTPLVADDPSQVPAAAWGAELEARLTALAARAPGIDRGLTRATEKARQHLERTLARLTRRYERLAVARHEVTASRLERARRWLRPDGAPQERVHGFAAYAARVGITTFHDAVTHAVQPLDPTLREIDL